MDSTLSGVIGDGGWMGRARPGAGSVMANIVGCCIYKDALDLTFLMQIEQG